MAYTSNRRIGRTVRITAGMSEFVGQIGQILDIEDGMYRVYLETPVFVPGVGEVTNDLWEGSLLHTIRGL